MATGSWPNLVDVSNITDGSGNIMRVAQMLSQSNDVYTDAPMVMANERTGHLFGFQTSIPTGSWRAYNVGTPASKGTTAKSRVGMGMLEDYSVVDRALAEHTGDVEKFRRSQDVAFLEGMGQTIVQTMIYGNTAVTPSEFQGLSTFYNTVNTNSAQNAANVLDGGGVGSSNCSLWMIGWGPETIYGIFPPGSQGGGLNFEDKSDVRAAYDSLGNSYEAYTGWFRQQIGLVPQDWRYGARIANIDVTSAGLAGPNALDIFATMAEMQFLFPKLTSTTSGITSTDAPDGEPGVRTVFYANRTLLHWMQVQAMRDRNVLARQEDYAGIVTDNWRGLPIKLNDQQTNTESRVV